MTELHVESAGAGPPVVLIHGFTGDGSTMAALADRLRSDHEVVSVDLVGHGRSPAPAAEATYSVDAMADDIATVIASLGPGPAAVVGYSMGGRVALTLACRRPALVRSLVLVGASAGLASAAERAERIAADDALARRIETVGLEAFVDHWMALPLFASQARLGPEFLAAARAQRLSCDPAGLTRSLRAAGTGSMTPIHDRLGECEVPTLFVVGGLDEKFSAIAGSMAAAMPDAAVHAVPGVGHAAHLEAPDEVAAAVRRHFDSS